MKADVTTLDAKKAGSVDLDDAVFGADVREDIMARMVRYQLAKRQQGTHHTQDVGDVSRTSAKFGRQKGGGRARHGNRRHGNFIGGAKAHAPKSRSHAHDLPKKIRRLALISALASKQAEGKLIILDKAEVKEPKTQALKAQFEKLGFSNVLIIDGEAVNENFAKAARNIPHVDVLPSVGANVYDILRRDMLVLTQAAVEKLEARLK